MVDALLVCAIVLVDPRSNAAMESGRLPEHKADRIFIVDNRSHNNNNDKNHDVTQFFVEAESAGSVSSIKCQMLDNSNDTTI